MANTQSHSLTRLLALGLLTTQIAAHGYVQGIVADGVYYPGYRPSFQYLSSPPKVPGWSEPKNLDNGFINNYQSPDIICHLSATPGQAYATVQAGGTVELQWTPWPTAHLGPVLSYLANCNGDCTTVDKTTLLFNKIDAVGLIKGGYSPGYWGASTLIANNNSWTLTIPPSIAPGNYVLRHEIIALQQADAVGGAQNYPQCINLKVTGSGTNSLQTGTKATAFYTSQDPGILINIYQALSNYIIPGPPLLGGVSSGNGPQPASNLTGPSPASFPNTTATAGIYSNTSTTAATNTSTAMLNATTPTASARLASLSATPGVFVPTTLSTVTSLGGAASPFAVDEAVSTTTETDYTTTTVTVTAPGVFAVTSGSTASDPTTTTEAGNADPVDPTSTSTGFSACIPWTTTPPTTGSATYTGPVIAGRPTGTSSGFLTRTTTAPFGVLYDAGNSTSVYASGSGTAFVMGTGVGTVTVTIMGTVTDYATTTPRVDASGFAARARVDNGFRAKQRRRALLRDRQ